MLNQTTFAYTVIASEAEAEFSSSSGSECANNSDTRSETASPINDNATNLTCSTTVAADRCTTDHSRDTTPVSDSDRNQKMENNSGMVSDIGKFEHRMQFFSNGFTNGLSSPASVNYHLKQTYPSNTLPLYSFKPEVIANPLLLLASCATQLHKAHTTLSKRNQQPD